MTAGPLQRAISIRAGDSGTDLSREGLQVRLVDADGPLNLTGETFSFTIWAANGTTLIMSKSSASGGILVEALEGMVTVPFSPTETQALAAAVSTPPEGLIYALACSNGPADHRTLMWGDLLVARGAPNV